MNVGTKLDDRLLRAMKEGPDALPGDLNRLAGYLAMVAGLLEEKAAELEPTWAMARATAAEIETLQNLELAVAARAAAVRSESVRDLRTKIAIWRSLAPDADEDATLSLRDRLILSIDADLERLTPGGRNTRPAGVIRR